MEEKEGGLIFVYGTLRAGSGHPMAERLAREAEWLGNATVEGRLFRISWYPGLKRAEGGGQSVLGDVYRLRTPGETLAWLDEYEASAGDSPEYERVRTLVSLQAGGMLEVWVYYYLGSVESAEFLAHGDFLRPA